MAASTWVPSWPTELLGGRPLPLAVPSIWAGLRWQISPAQSGGWTTRLGCVVQHHHQQHEAILAVPKDRHFAMLLQD